MSEENTPAPKEARDAHKRSRKGEVVAPQAAESAPTAVQPPPAARRQQPKKQTRQQRKKKK